MPIFPVQPSRRGRLFSCHTPARELTWEELGGGYGTKFTQTTCKVPMTSPSRAAAASLGLRHSSSTGCQAFNRSLAAGEIPTKSASDQAGRKVLECEGNTSITSSHRFSSHAQDLFRCLQLCPWHCLAARLTRVSQGKELLPHLISPVQQGRDLGHIFMSLPPTPWW